MGLKNDRWIRQMVAEKQMIDPFADSQVREGVISYGVSSYGYDMRVTNEFKVFTNLNSTVVDPKHFDPLSFTAVETEACVIPPNSFALARSVEYFRIPRGVLVVCLGKSTYARCFTGDTKVALVDGRTATLKEMAEGYKLGNRYFGYTVRKNGKIGVEELVNPRLTRRKADLVAVTLDSGDKIRCTPDHLFMLRDGSYKEASKLKEDDRLMPLSRGMSNAYEYILDTSSAGKVLYTHELADAWNRRRKIYEKSKGNDRHHVDLNPRNNDPRNIIRLTHSEHAALHSKLKVEKLLEDPEYLRFYGSRISDGIQEYIEENSEKYKENRSARSLKFWHDPKFASKRESYLSRNRELWGDEDKRKQHSKLLTKLTRQRLGIHISKKLVLAAIKAEGAVYKAADKLGVSRQLLYRRFKNMLTKAQELGYTTHNHAVVSVRNLKETEDVYDVTVPRSHNFALESGVFVHNCGMVVNVTPLEPSWEGFVTLEISNTTPLPAKIYANEGIAQVLFFEADEECVTSYADKKGKYQKQQGIVLPKL